jgi:hypothetical protein
VKLSSALALSFTMMVAWASLSLTSLGAPGVSVERMPVAAHAAA